MHTNAGTYDHRPSQSSPNLNQSKTMNLFHTIAESIAHKIRFGAVLRTIATMFLVVASLNTPALAGPATETDKDKPGTHLKGDDPHHTRRHLALFFGATRFEGHARFTLGGDFEYRLGFAKNKFGVGALAETTFGDHPATIVGGALFVHPVKSIKVILAPGVEFSHGHREFLFRSGLGYDLHVGQASVTPSVSLDFVSGHVVQVYGVSVGLGF